MFSFSSSYDIPYGFWFVGSLEKDQRWNRQAAPVNVNILKDMRDIGKRVTQIQNELKLLLMIFQKRSDNFSGFPADSEGFYFPEIPDFPVRLYSQPAIDKNNVEREDFHNQSIPFPRLG